MGWQPKERKRLSDTPERVQVPFDGSRIAIQTMPRFQAAYSGKQCKQHKNVTPPSIAMMRFSPMPDRRNLNGDGRAEPTVALKNVMTLFKCGCPSTCAEVGNPNGVPKQVRRRCCPRS